MAFKKHYEILLRDIVLGTAESVMPHENETLLRLCL